MLGISQKFDVTKESNKDCRMCIQFICATCCSIACIIFLSSGFFAVVTAASAGFLLAKACTKCCLRDKQMITETSGNTVIVMNPGELE